MIEGKIYKIINKDFPGMFYYGSTTQKLKKRLAQHRRNNTCSSKILMNGNEEIILIQNKICNTRKELLNREKWFIQNFKCINKYLPNPTDEEKLYKQRLTIKKNYEKNKEKIKLWHRNRNKERVICPKCLKNLARSYFTRHCKICNQ